VAKPSQSRKLVSSSSKLVASTTHSKLFSLKRRCSYHSTAVLKSNETFDLPEIHEARSLLAQDKFIKAEALVNRAQEIAKYAVGENSVPYAELVELNARCKFGRNLFSDSASLFLSALQIYFQNSKSDACLRVLPQLVASVLRVEDTVDLSRYFTFARNLPHSPEPTLNLTIFLAKLQLLSVEYHRCRIKSAHTAMHAIDQELASEIAKVDLSALPNGSMLTYRWHLSVGRWYQTIYDLRREESQRQSAVESYNAALKAEAVTDEEKRTASLIRADALLGLGDLARIAEKWEEADEYYKKAVDITDQFFDRDSQRVRRVIEREAVVQFHLRRWLHAEGLMRRLIDYYNDHQPLNGSSCPQAQYDCLQAYVKLLESRGRGSEVAALKAKLGAVESITPSSSFDPYAF
jgi:tetratricopeptide (TPR) repeat protein